MSDTYNEQVKKVAVEYRNRAMAVLTAIKQELDSSALVINGPSDLSGDEYIWSMCAFSPAVEFGHGPLVDVTVTICESRDYQGTDGGINFRLRAEAVNDNGTTTLGECTPCNFTPDVWVPLDQPEAIAARFALIEEMPAAETAKLVMDYLLPHRRRPEQDAELTKVIFRRYRSGLKELLALFPEVEARRGLCSCYAHVGQHSDADYTYVVGLTTPVNLTDPDVVELKAELEEIGYRLDVRRRRSYK